MKKFIGLGICLGIVLLSLTFGSAGVWDSGLNNDLVSYYTFNNGDGTNLNDSLGINNGTLYNMEDGDWGTGILGNALNFGGVDEYVNITNDDTLNLQEYTINYWLKKEAGNDFRVMYKKAPGNGYQTNFFSVFATNAIQFLAGNTAGNSYGIDIQPGVDITDGNWEMITMKTNLTQAVLYINGTIAGTDNFPSVHLNNGSIIIGIDEGGGTLDYVGALDEMGIWNRSLTNAEITNLWNDGDGISYGESATNISVALNNPVDGELFSKVGTNFTASYTTASYNLTNATYYIWKNGIEINHSFVEITGTSNSTTQYIDDFTLASYEWNIYACGIDAAVETRTNCVWANSNYTFNVGASIVNQSYSNGTYETQTETFYLNLNLLPGIILYDAQLFYNGSFYESIETEIVQGNYSISSTIDIPVVSSQSETKQFHWRLIYPVGNDFVYQNLTSINQTVNQTIMGACNLTLTTKSLNFSAFDEENLTNLDTFDFYGTFEYWLGTGSERKNFSISNAGTTNQSICLSHNFTYYSDAIIQYEKTDYIKRNYYLVNSTLTNVTSNIELVSLLTTSSTTFILEVLNDIQFPITKSYIYMQRYYPGTGVFKTVEMALTDTTGSTIGHFEKETEDYKFLIIKNGVVLYESEIQKIILGEVPYTITFNIVVGVSTLWQDYGDLPNLIWSLVYDEITKIWSYTYVDTSGTTNYGRLHVYQEKGGGETTICNVNSSSSAATLICNVTDYEGNIYAAGYISRSPEVLVYLKSILNSGLKDIFGMEGLFLSFFILLMLALVGLWNPAVGIILMVFGMILMTFIGLASFGATTIWGIIFIAIIILWSLRT